MLFRVRRSEGEAATGRTFAFFMIHRLLLSLGFEWFDYGSDRIYRDGDRIITASYRSMTPSSKEEPIHVMVKWTSKR